MAASQDVEDHAEGAGVRADVSFDQHQRLALAMLAVEGGDFAAVRDAMRKVIASAPEAADVALLLSLALAHAGDRTLEGEHMPSRWWVVAAVPFLGAAVLFWWLGDLALQAPDEGAGAAGTAAMSMFAISVGSLGTALIGVETLFLLRWQARGAVAQSVSLVRPPGWYADPWDQAPSRWWNGFNWAGHVN